METGQKERQAKLTAQKEMCTQAGNLESPNNIQNEKVEDFHNLSFLTEEMIQKDGENTRVYVKNPELGGL